MITDLNKPYDNYDDSKNRAKFFWDIMPFDVKTRYTTRTARNNAATANPKMVIKSGNEFFLIMTVKVYLISNCLFKRNLH